MISFSKNIKGLNYNLINEYNNKYNLITNNININIKSNEVQKHGLIWEDIYCKKYISC